MFSVVVQLMSKKELRIAVWLCCSEVRSTCGVENREFVRKRDLGQQEPPEGQCGSWIVPTAAAARQEC